MLDEFRERIQDSHNSCLNLIWVLQMQINFENEIAVRSKLLLSERLHFIIGRQLNCLQIEEYCHRFHNIKTINKSIAFYPILLWCAAFNGYSACPLIQLAASHVFSNRNSIYDCEWWNNNFLSINLHRIVLA